MIGSRVARWYIFSNQKSHFGNILEDLEMENVVIPTLWPFGIHSCHLVIYVVVFWYLFPHFGLLYHEKSGNPDRWGGGNAPICIIMLELCPEHM
jgi:hypothetical protein